VVHATQEEEKEEYLGKLFHSCITMNKLDIYQNAFSK